MYPSVFNSFLADNFFSPSRTVYVISDSQLEELKRKQYQEELDTTENQIKVLDERKKELKKELKSLAACQS